MEKKSKSFHFFNQWKILRGILYVQKVTWWKYSSNSNTIIAFLWHHMTCKNGSSNMDKIVSVLIIYRVFWVLVNVLRAQNHRATQHTRVADRGSLLDGGLSDYYTESWPWTIVGNMFRECHTPCMLKTSLVDLKKRVDTL